MSPAQTTYVETIKAPPPGTVHGSFDKTDSITGNVEDDDGIPAGRAVGEGTVSTHGDKAVIMNGNTLAKFIGVTIRDITLLPAANSDDQDKYPEYSNCAVMTRGEIWLEPGEAVNAYDPVYFNGTTGVFYKQATGGALGPIKGAQWTSTCAVNGRATAYFPGLRNQDAV